MGQISRERQLKRLLGLIPCTVYVRLLQYISRSDLLIYYSIQVFYGHSEGLGGRGMNRCKRSCHWLESVGLTLSMDQRPWPPPQVISQSHLRFPTPPHQHLPIKIPMPKTQPC